MIAVYKEVHRMHPPATVRNLHSPISEARHKNLKLALLLGAGFLLLDVGHSFGQATIPHTPAGRTLRAWLDAFNSGDRTKIDADIKTVDPQQPVERMLGLHRQT